MRSSVSIALFLGVLCSGTSVDAASLFATDQGGQPAFAGEVALQPKLDWGAKIPPFDQAQADPLYEIPLPATGPLLVFALGSLLVLGRQRRRDRRA